MNLKSYEIDRFRQLPDIHGALYDAIEEFKPLSHLKLENDIKSFLNYIDPDKIEKNPPISATMLIAPWGLGKTTSYDVVLKNLLETEEFEGISIKLRAQDISNYYDTFSITKNFKLIAENADRYLYILSKLMLNIPELRDILPSDIEKIDDIKSVSKILEELQKNYKFLVIFIDELEEVVKAKNAIIPFILKSTKDLLNGSSKIVNSKSNRNFLSFILACTDAAFYEVSRLEELEYQFGGIKRRIPEISIEDITLQECIEYLVKLNKFCYKGKFVESFLNAGASFNTLARMAMRNPGHMKSLFTILMNKSASQHPGSLMYQIDGNFILEYCQNYKLEYMETQRRSLSGEIYTNWLKKFLDDPIISSLIKILIGELQPIKIQDIIDRFDEKIPENTIIDCFSRFNKYIRSIHSNVGEAILQVNLFNKDFTSADLQNLLNNCGYKIETSEEIKPTINFKSDGIINLDDFLENLSFFEVDEDASIKIKFFFTTDTEILRQQLFPYLSNTTINTLKNEFKKHLDTEIDYYILNPALFNMIFPLPIPKEFNLLDDKNDNVRLWTDISRKKKSEIYRKDICTIISNFFITNEIINKSALKDFKPLTKDIPKFSYFNELKDKNQFIILENYVVNGLSKYPINIMFLREIGDYSSSIMNDIAILIEKYQKNEMKNIHLLLLISQNKIPEELIINLNSTLDFTIVKEIPLSQFDITKFAFLNELYQNYEGKYDDKNFNIATNQLKVPFNELLISIREDVDIKGLNIKLNSTLSNLSEIPQLMKHILYDFDNDYRNWNAVVIKKPFNNINPIGLSPRYSSSLDDWSEDRLKTSVNEYLLVNGFVDIKENHLKVSMPLLEKNILKLLKFLSKYSILLTREELQNFFIDTSTNRDLFKDVFVADLENRGIIDFKQKQVFLVELDELSLKQKYDELNRKIKLLRIRDISFYHIFTIKQKDYSLIFLNDFIEVLNKLMDLEESNNQNIHFKYTKNVIFMRIYSVFNQIIDKIFFSMDLKISKLETDLEKISIERLNTDYIELKLKEYGLQNIDIKSFSEVAMYIDNVNKLNNSFHQRVDKLKLNQDLQFYYKIHKKDVRLQSEPFSYLKLQQNKLKSDFNSPYLNYLYHEIINNLKRYDKDPVIEHVDNVKKYIDEVDRKHNGIKSQITKISISDEKSLAYCILDAVSRLSTYEFVKREENVENLREIEGFLKGLIKEIERINVPITRILKRASIGPAESLIDKIFNVEQEIRKLESLFKDRITFCIEQNVCENKDELNKLYNVFKVLDLSSYISEIKKCKNLNELADQSDQIFRDLDFEKSKIEGKLLSINSLAYEFFKNFKDLESLIKLFQSFRMRGYAKQCESYIRSIERLKVKNYEIDFKGIINHLLSLRSKIEEGHNKILEEELPETSQMLYQKLYENYSNKGSFSGEELFKIAKKIGLAENDIEQSLDELFKKKLIEKRYSFIS